MSASDRKKKRQACAGEPLAAAKPAPLIQTQILRALGVHAAAINSAFARLETVEKELNALLPKKAHSAPSRRASPQPPTARGSVPSRLDIVHRAPVWMTMSERVVLYSLIVGLRPSRCLEIGTFRGGSAMIIVSALDDIGSGSLVCVDPNAQVSGENWQSIAHRALLFRQPSPGIIPEAARAIGGPFDFALIDGDHSSDGLARDIEGVLPHLGPGAYLLFHDAYYHEVAEAIRQALDRNRHSLTDCGMISVEQTTDANPGIFWGGLQLLRYASGAPLSRASSSRAAS